MKQVSIFTTETRRHGDEDLIFPPCLRVSVVSLPLLLTLLACACGSTGEDDDAASAGDDVITGVGGGASVASSGGHVASSTSSAGMGGSGGRPGLGPPYPIVLAHGFFG